MPARITEPAVGASTWASGSHVWNGHIGTLIAKPSAKAKNRSICIVPIGNAEPSACRYMILNVLALGSALPMGTMQIQCGTERLQVTHIERALAVLGGV